MPPALNAPDTLFVLLSTALVLLMTPALALFYGGLVRAKSILNTMMMSLVAVGVVGLLWALLGYSLAFGGSATVLGDLSFTFMNGVGLELREGGTIPHLLFFAYQGTFAIITAALISGAIVERMRFSAYVLFLGAWTLLVYSPVAHWVWGGGWMGKLGILDFAGGTVVHINAAVAGLIGAYLTGKRIGYGRESMAPHSLTMTMIGASLLWFGWFGFNAGSALEANGIAALAFVNTWVATAMAATAWMATDWAFKGKPSMLGAASGAVAGLVAITPAAGFVGVGGALVIGLAAGVVCLWGVNGLKKLLGADDSLDVFGVHGIGGILGALLTGVFAAPSLGGTGVWDYVANKVADGYDIGAQVMIQATGVGTTIVWSGVVAFIAYKIVDVLIGLRVPEDEEREGLDITAHGESAYHY